MMDVDATQEEDWQASLLRKGKGKLDAVAANAITILRHTDEWKGVIAYDAFRGDVTSTKPPPWHPDDAPTEAKAGPWSGADITRLQSWLRRKWSLSLSADAVKAALLVEVYPPAGALLRRGTDVVPVTPRVAA